MKALILGVGGQDGSYLAEILLENGYEVHGMYRKSSYDNLWRLRHICKEIILHQGDMTDTHSLTRTLMEAEADIVFNEADQDEVGWSFKSPKFTMDVTASAVMNLLEIIRVSGRHVKVFQPVSATMFGNAPFPQNEQTPFNPLSPYACAKAASYYICRYYRQVYKMFVSTGILYNHDSTRRSDGPLLQYLSRSVIRIVRGEQPNLPIAYPDALVDIGYAKEYMQGVFGLMQLNVPGDFILGTGQGLTIRHLAEVALGEVALPPSLVVPNPSFSRIDPQCTLLANAKKANRAFGFKPKVSAERVVRSLVNYHREHLPCA
jgi:GDPmannose 4,6-dehydratase